jgi:hypothetical protein
MLVTTMLYAIWRPVSRQRENSWRSSRPSLEQFGALRLVRTLQVFRGRDHRFVARARIRLRDGQIGEQQGDAVAERALLLGRADVDRHLRAEAQPFDDGAATLEEAAHRARDDGQHDVVQRAAELVDFLHRVHPQPVAAVWPIRIGGVCEPPGRRQELAQPDRRAHGIERLAPMHAPAPRAPSAASRRSARL